MTTALYLPGAIFKPVSYRADSGFFTPGFPIGWCLHVQAGNGSPLGTFEGAVSPYRRFSTAWVAKTGVSEQYAELNRIPWSQAAGNPFFWGIETEGFPNEPLTPAQIATLARFHRALGTADIVATSPMQHGINCHYVGGLGWGGHTCPDPAPGVGPRSRQRGDIISAARGTASPVRPPLVNGKARNPAQTRDIEGCVRVVVDGRFGHDTLLAGNVVIRKTMTDVRYLQGRVGAATDGAWGPRSEASWVATVKGLQNILLVKADGNFGPVSLDAWNKVVFNNYMNF